MNMIEKVARAIDKQVGVKRVDRLQIAKAAIQAMRDLPAGFNSDERGIFNAAIDKALED